MTLNKHFILFMVIGAFYQIVFMNTNAIAAHYECGPQYCNVDDFYGTDDEKIEAAIDAALQTSHRTVYFPGRVFTITRNITFNFNRVHLRLVGESANSTILRGYSEDEPGGINNHIINISFGDGYDECDMEIHNMKLDFSNSGTFGGHGIRVGSGWHSGRLWINNVKIWRAPSYGIAINKEKDTDRNGDRTPANNVRLSNIYVLGSGRDGIDTKGIVRDGVLSTGLTMDNVTIDHFATRHVYEYKDTGVRVGGKGTAGIDISYDTFYLKNITVIDTQKQIVDPDDDSNLLPKQEINAIRFRTRKKMSASNGIVRNFYTKITSTGSYGVAFEQWPKVPGEPERDLTENITLKQFVIKDSPIGISVSGIDHVLKNGCVIGGVIRTHTVENLDNRVGWRRDQCPSMSNVGSSYGKKSDVKLVDVGP